MCGRYVLLAPPRRLAEVFGVTVPDDMGPRWNIAPTQRVGLVRQTGATRLWDEAGWGLVPGWARSFRPGPVNARIESVAEKPTFREALRRRRCLVPASAWYEWTGGGKTKQAWAMEPISGEPVAFAGLWEDWGTGDAMQRTVAFLTTEATGRLAEVHHRMPVLLGRATWERWLDPGLTDASAALACVADLPDGSVVPRRVGRAVHRAGLEGPECLASPEAAEDAPTGGQLGLF
ncbi:MAG: SOS response-associated peptidase [Candidatus Sericytochromatia bacterium]|nr:SOS response-associated peptidase [Candidatus Sericytochromatia bacterium]